MIKQKSFNYKFNYKNDNELNFFVNKTNFYAFNALINNDTKLSFLYGPKKSGKSYLSKIWLKKNNAIEYNNNYEVLLNLDNNILIDNLIFYDQEKIFHIVNNCILNNSKILITGGTGSFGKKFLEMSNKKFKFTKKMINSKSKNSPFLGKILIGKVFITIVNGKIIFDNRN